MIPGRILTECRANDRRLAVRLAMVRMCFAVVSAAASNACAPHLRYDGAFEATFATRDDRRLVRLVTGELPVQEAWCNAEAEVDRRFETDGFVGPPLSVTRGSACVLAAQDRSDDARALLLLEVDTDGLTTGRVLGTGAFVPYFSWTPEDAEHRPALVCKGGTGRIALQGASPNRVRGTLAIRVACRSYLGAVEREQTEIAITGELNLSRKAEPPRIPPSPSP